ncbi:hypothetical protein LEP1GSC047_4396 [Leptospira inadai serovar Lyme str. 10]|uniref:DUF218 domain-containing protein n=2 Tax=Leptospira inadai serovar Lyme TaxID=293084 RepID=V6HDW9_9LEPT|nr:hypothetical protein [Leptospira inadai]EQA37368.1 hypothetical protein LEP1GSC047_4396 [Leptospira inadai serovar Lyme str. 10]PNV72075.1 hypothetical protein BES34_020205 [Leptospira inadai serovar Lyme]
MSSSPLSVQEFLSKTKLVSYGAFGFLFLFLILFFSAPLLLVSKADPKKSDAIVVEAIETGRKDKFKQAAALWKKGLSPVILVLYSPGGNDSDLGIGSDLASNFQSFLTSQGVEENKILVYTVSAGPQEFPKTLLKIALDRQWKNFLLVGREFDSATLLRLYRSVLEPAGIYVAVSKVPEGFSATDWFLKPKSLESILGRLAKYYYLILLGI